MAVRLDPFKNIVNVHWSGTDPDPYVAQKYLIADYQPKLGSVSDCTSTSFGTWGNSIGVAMSPGVGYYTGIANTIRLIDNRAGGPAIEAFYDSLGNWDGETGSITVAGYNLPADPAPNRGGQFSYGIPMSISGLVYSGHEIGDTDANMGTSVTGLPANIANAYPWVSGPPLVSVFMPKITGGPDEYNELYPTYRIGLGFSKSAPGMAGANWYRSASNIAIDFDCSIASITVGGNSYTPIGYYVAPRSFLRSYMPVKILLSR